MEPSGSQIPGGKGKGKEKEGHNDDPDAAGSSRSTRQRTRRLSDRGTWVPIKPPGDKFFIPDWDDPQSVEDAWQMNQPLFVEQKRKAIEKVKRRDRLRSGPRRDFGPRLIAGSDFTASARRVAGYLSMRTNVEFWGWLTETEGVSNHFEHFLELREDSFGCGNISTPMHYQFSNIAMLSVYIDRDMITDDQGGWPSDFPPNKDGFQQRMCLSFMRLAYNILQTAQTNMISRRAFSGPVHPLLSKTYLGMEAEDLNRVLEAHRHHNFKAGQALLTKQGSNGLMRPLWMELPVFMDEESGGGVFDGSDNLPVPMQDGQSGVGNADSSHDRPISMEAGQSGAGNADGSRDRPILLEDSPSSVHRVDSAENEADEQWGSAFSTYTEAEREAMMELGDPEMAKLFQKWESEYDLGSGQESER